jgi:hypothetical protein
MHDQGKPAEPGHGGLAVTPCDLPVTFAGDLFLTLAAEGRLVVDAVRADRLIDSLEQALALITTRLQVAQAWQQLPDASLDGLPTSLVQSVVDAVFVAQLAPGQLERTAAELPKYIAALRVARVSGNLHEA